MTKRTLRSVTWNLAEGAILVAIVWVLLPERSHWKCGPSSPTIASMVTITRAIAGYAAELGVAPSGDSKAILLALRGDNPSATPFLSKGLREAPDELLDPWGHSYDVAVVAGDRIRVRSAGPNGILGDRDDARLETRLDEALAEFR